jgi:hypothetical protein
MHERPLRTAPSLTSRTFARCAHAEPVGGATPEFGQRESGVDVLAQAEFNQMILVICRRIEEVTRPGAPQRFTFIGR